MGTTGIIQAGIYRETGRSGKVLWESWEMHRSPFNRRRLERSLQLNHWFCVLWVGGPVSNGHSALASAHHCGALPVHEPLRLDLFSLGPNEHPGGSLLWFHKGQGRSLKSTGPPRPASASRRLMMTAMAASSLLGLLDPGSSMMSILRWELSPAGGDSFSALAREY